jgi:Protein of unknown function (DUF3096)
MVKNITLHDDSCRSRLRPSQPGSALAVLMPRLLNYVVAIYLLLVDAIVLNSIYHFIR